MKEMTLTRIANACHGTYIGREEDREKEVSCVDLDSRRIEEGGCFIAAKGERTDGHNFIPEVFARGALCAVCERLPEGDAAGAGNYIVVRDSFQALRDIGEYYRETLHIPIIGITGSVGKTSTKEFIAGTLSQKLRVLKTAGNFNNETGVPLTLLRIRQEHEAAVLEMGINHFGEMHRLSKMVKPDICVITNIGECHLEFLGSREGILKAKSEIFDFLREDGEVFLNGDDDMLQRIEKVRHKAPITFGLGKQNDYYADEIQSRGLFGCDAVIHTRSGAFNVRIPLPGEHMVRNALAAAAVAERFEMTGEEIAAGIAAAVPVGGRGNVIRRGALTIIDDCYNANPVSMRAALDLLASAEGRTVAVLGDMKELGENEAEFHAKIGAYAVEKRITGLICVGPLSREMYKGACRAKERTLSNTFVQYYEDLEKALEKIRAKNLFAGEAAVLVKASRGMHFEGIVKELSDGNEL